MYGCESWTIEKAECQRTDAFELWCSRRLLRVPWTARRSNQSILKEISPGCSLEGLMLKLKLQYFRNLIWRTDSFEKTLILERIEGEGDDRGWDGLMLSSTQWTWVWVSPRIGNGQGSLACCSPWGCKEWDTTEWLNFPHSAKSVTNHEATLQLPKFSDFYLEFPLIFHALMDLYFKIFICCNFNVVFEVIGENS